MWEPEQRESDRYPHEGLRQQLEDVVGWFPAHPNGTVALALIAGLLLVWRLISPWSVLGLEDVRPGDCLFARTASSRAALGSGPGGAAETRGVLTARAAEPAPCDGAHSHEVSAVMRLSAPDERSAPGATGQPGPASGAPATGTRAATGSPDYDAVALLAAAEQRCAASLPAYLGLAPGATSSAWVGFAVIPTESQWEAGMRLAVCLVTAADGRFPSTWARGSGR